MSAASRPLRPLWALLIAIVAVVLLPRIPVVGFLVLPLSWLGTLAHETGHGLGAMAMGGDITSIQVFVNGSGLARATRGASVWAPAVTAVSGLVGPAVVGMGLLWMGLTPRLARVGLGLLGMALLVEAATVTMGFATFVALGWGVVALLAAWKLHGEVARLGVLVVAVQLALHVWRKSGYLFVEEGTTSAGTFPSDIANVASSLGGHYLVWGVAVGLLDAALLGVGFAGFVMGDRLMRKASVDE